MHDILNVQEAANMLHVRPRTMYYWHEINRGPRAGKLGKRLIYRKSDIEDFIAAAF